MTTRKALLLELGEKVFEILEDEIINEGEELQVTFTFDLEGVKDVEAFRTTIEEIELDEDDI